MKLMEDFKQRLNVECENVEKLMNNYTNYNGAVR